MSTTIDTSRYPKKDSQRQKLYNAERAVFTGSEWDADLTEDDVRYEIRRGLQWLSKKYRGSLRSGFTTDTEVHFNFGYGGAKAVYGGGMFLTAHGLVRHESHFSFTPSSKKRWIVLHELAHAVDPRLHPEYDGDRRGHGWCFADVYLALVQHYFGVAWAKKLRTEFRTGKVRYRPKRNRNATPPKGNLPIREKATTVFVARPVERRSIPVPEGVVYATRRSHCVATVEGIQRRSLDDGRYGIWVEDGEVNYHGCTVIGDERRIPVLWRVSEKALRNALAKSPHYLGETRYEVIEVDRALVDPEFASEAAVA